MQKVLPFNHLSDSLKNFFVNLVSHPIFKPLKSIQFSKYFTFFIMAHDGLMSFVALFLSLYLKIGEEFLNYTPEYLLKNMLVFTFISLGIFSWAKTYKTLWRFIAVEDLWPLGLAVIIANICYIPAMFFLSSDESFSAFVPVLNIFVMMSLLSIPRFLARFVHDQIVFKQKVLKSAFTIPVLLVGDDDPAELFIRETRYTPDLPYNPVGIVTSDPHFEEGRAIHGVPILGVIDDIEFILNSFEEENLRPRQIIITDEKIKKDQLKKLIKSTSMQKIIILQMVQHFSLNVVNPE